MPASPGSRPQDPSGQWRQQRSGSARRRVNAADAALAQVVGEAVGGTAGVDPDQQRLRSGGPGQLRQGQVEDLDVILGGVEGALHFPLSPDTVLISLPRYGPIWWSGSLYDGEAGDSDMRHHGGDLPCTSVMYPFDHSSSRNVPG